MAEVRFDVPGRVALVPRGRLGQPEDVVGLVLFLVSEGARDITGQVIPIRR